MIKILPSKKTHKPDCFTGRSDQIFSEELIPTCFPHSSAGKESTCNAGDPGSIPESGRSAGKGIGYPLQKSGFTDSSDSNESTCNAGDLGSIPGLGNGYPL